MSTQPQYWTFDTVPDSFWQRIAEAHGDADRFLESLKSVTQRELQEMYWQYCDLAERLFETKHYSHMDSTNDGHVMDLANWIVMQGRNYYLDVRSHPKKTPASQTARGMSFLSQILLEYWKRYDEDIPDR
jgi:hypothetical protein